MRKWLCFGLATLFCVAGVAFLVAYALVKGPTAEIRLDTGDLRYLYLGIPIQYDLMPEPERSQLISLTAGSNALKSEWHSCAMHVGSNNSNLMCAGFYMKAAAWIAVDRPLARLVVADIATYIRNTDARQGLPDSVEMLSFSIVDRNNNGTFRVMPSWQQNEMVLDYLQRKGYSPPATQPAK
jgi:hypothetical protein